MNALGGAPDGSLRHLRQDSACWSERPEADVIEAQTGLQEPLMKLLLENQRLRRERDQALENVRKAVSALERAVQASGTDALTALPNRLILQDRLSHDLLLAERHDASLLLLYIDVDDFKRVNDCYGHPVGDALLQGVARRLQAAVRVSDSVCRVGGDEFVVLMPAIQPGEAERVVRKVAEAVETPLAIEDHVLNPRVSIGVALYPRDGRTPEELIRSADSHMYRVKQTRHLGG